MRENKTPFILNVNAYSCYNNTCLLLVLGSDATLPVKSADWAYSLHNEISKSTSWKKLCWPCNGHSALHLYSNAASYMCWVPFCRILGSFLHTSLCSWKVMLCSYYVMRFVCFIIILNQMFHFSSPSEISPINRCIVLYGFVAVLVMVKLHVDKSVLILRATSGLNFVASCSHLKENITGLDGLWIIKYLCFTDLLLPLSNKCGVGQYMWNDFYALPLLQIPGVVVHLRGPFCFALLIYIGEEQIVKPWITVFKRADFYNAYT